MNQPCSEPRALLLIFRLCGLLVLGSVLAGCSAPRQAAKAPSEQAISRNVVLQEGHRQEVVLTALGLIDTRYRYGGSNPGTGFDCSGLVNYVVANVSGQSLPRQSADIARASRRISRSKLKAGDLVFFNTLNRPYSHVGIYIGNGQFVNAPSSGGRVRIDSLSNPYFSRRFESAHTLYAAS